MTYLGTAEAACRSEYRLPPDHLFEWTHPESGQRVHLRVNGFELASLAEVAAERHDGRAKSGPVVAKAIRR